MKILMLLPMFLQTDAVDDSLIDLRSGPPGFLNDPIFTPSNASQHPQHPQEAMHRTSAAMLGWGCQQVQVVTLFSDSLNMSAYKCVEMKLGLLLFCCKSKNEAYVRKNPGILLQRKAFEHQEIFSLFGELFHQCTQSKSAQIEEMRNQPNHNSNMCSLYKSASS